MSQLGHYTLLIHEIYHMSICFNNDVKDPPYLGGNYIKGGPRWPNWGSV